MGNNKGYIVQLGLQILDRAPSTTPLWLDTRLSPIMHMNVDDIDAITASLPTMFAPTLVSRTQDSAVPPETSDWTDDPGYATQGLFDLVDLTLCDGDPSPPQSPNQALSEQKEDGYSILADPYFDHTMVDDEAFHDALESLLALGNPAADSENEHGSPEIRKCASVASTSLSLSSPSPSTQDPSSRGNELTFEEKLKATAQGFHGSIGQSERKAMVAHIMSLTSPQRIIPSTSDASQSPARSDADNLFHSPYQQSGLPETSFSRGTQIDTTSRPKRQHSSNDSFDMRQEKQPRTDDSSRPFDQHFDGPSRSYRSQF